MKDVIFIKCQYNKMKINNILLFFMPVLLLPLFTEAQTKFEKEYRIKTDEVPETALQFIRTSNTDLSEKWYYEENQLDNSIEAKFKFNKKRYSVEFDTMGNLQDIEIETDFEALAEALQSKITASLQNNYSKHKIRKLQVQYSGDINSLAELLENSASQNRYKVRYEIIVKGRKNRQWNLYEITFNHAGELKKTDQIIFRNTDNLEF